MIDLAGYDQRPEFSWGRQFFYAPANDHDRILAAARFPFMLLAIIAAALIFRAARPMYGDVPAFAASIVFLFTPEVLAHSQWAHSDVAAAVGTLLVAVALANASENSSRKSDVLLGAALGIAVLSKITSLILVPLALLVVAFFAWRAQPRSVKRLLARLGVIVATLWLVIVIGYLPHPRLLPHHLSAADSGARMSRILEWLPVPDNFLKGVLYTQLLARNGQISYFHGAVSNDGWWYYYPVALVLKYPTPFLLLAIAGLALFLKSDRITLAKKLAFVLPPFVILALAMTNHVNRGVRVVLPLAPFFAIWSAAAIAAARERVPKITAYSLLVLSVASGIFAYPNFLAYFNPLAGGTKNATTWLADSNVDWGQDLPTLAKTLQRRNVNRVHLAYFGMADPRHWGIHGISASRREAGWYAISRSYLSGWWPPGDPYAWLRAQEPVELVGGSIALFHVDSAAVTHQP
jgi:4-amino-4-deoxy-L-arabinose transferase-like glycosyltransferase